MLAKHWPDVPIHTDIRELTGDAVGPVDVICGGFPCQPFSSAAHGNNVAEDLWPWMAGVVEDVRPRWVVAENVTKKAIGNAEHELQQLGYGTWTGSIGAEDCGADHKRARWWLCAYTDHESQFYRAIHAEVAKLPAICRGVWNGSNYARALRVPNGLSNRLDRLRALGNAVVPQVVERIGQAILVAHRRQT